MTKLRTALALILALVAGMAVAVPAFARAPEVSVRPLARPVAEAPVARAAVAKPATALAVSVSPRPLQRPDLARAVAASVTVTPPRVVMVSASAAAVRLSPRPPARPENIERRTTVRAAGVRTQPGLPLLTGRRGSVCGLVAIQGETVAPIPGRISGCGIDDPVKVTSVSGITLSQAAIMDCTTARALNAWVDQAVVPAVGRLGGGLAGLKVAAHYSCRTRNNQPGARISEHGKGRAIDISALILKNGVQISVLKGWDDRDHARLLRTVHAAACGPFGTVLGPDADRFHKDHFHFDTASYRSGPYCK